MFDWNQVIENVPDAWRATEGKGVKIAILDSGANLDHPALQHLKPSARTFWVAKPGFNPTQPPSATNDNVADAMPGGKPHGTALLSVLAADPVNDQMKGVAPQADYIVIKTADANALSSDVAVVNGIDLALKLGAEVIVCALLPIESGQLTEGRKQDVFGRVASTGVTLVATLDNSAILNIFNHLAFPSDQAASIVTGTAKPALLSALQPGDTFDPHIAFLHPAVDITQAAVTDVETVKCRSSQSVAALGGLAALQISVWKTAEGPQYRPRKRADMLAALSTAAQDFSADAMLAATAPSFFKPSTSV